MGAIIVVDAFWGDSGKGKIAAYLARRERAAYSVRAGTGTNAGHSLFFADGREIRTHQLPCGFLDPQTQVRVGSGVAVDPDRFFEELDRLDPEYALADRTRVDFRCPIILPEYREREANDGHLDPDVTGARTRKQLTAPVRGLIDALEDRFDLPVSLCDCGKQFEDIVELS